MSFMHMISTNSGTKPASRVVCLVQSDMYNTGIIPALRDVSSVKHDKYEFWNHICFKRC